ncbi:metal-dependent protein hydrolase [Annulohypoxylon truncatum]|uniref:metal-dependent protein hydrolase n=1 Tax=Annulohypoxylon truncatum TaxID=327061 RepID=UPI00200840FB|nr:metal-dependent protein hydrolase [Annulohypoxylon truncatum]KAI1207209.1 metal-dependent protein hydrolase [Annulohypoxylon truncatum]
MAENAAKRLKTSEGGAGVRIGTHNGHFHADEALAVYMLRLLPTYTDSELVRTRDPALLETCHTVVDVGGEYDAARNRYDHHQRTFDTVFPGRETKLSSAGLVYLHFGRSIIARQTQKPEDSAEVGLLWNKIYESFVEAMDAHDNGISKYDSAKLEEAGIEKRFSSAGFTLGAMVSRLNPNWNDARPADRAEAQAWEDEKFVKASERLGDEFSRTLNFYANAWLPARTVVEEAYAKRMQFDPEGRIMVFEGQSVPWKDHLYTLEEEEQTDKKVLYVLYAEKQTPDAAWRIQAVPETENSFQSRKPLPEPWRGARDSQLDEISGVPGGIFVHASGFIGGNKTFDGVKALADKACAF